MVYKLNFIFPATDEIKNKIREMKEKLNLKQNNFEEGAGATLTNEDAGIQIDIIVTHDDEFNLFYNIIAMFTKEEQGENITKYLGAPSRRRVTKPSIMDVCDKIIQNKDKSGVALISDLREIFKLTEEEVHKYINDIKKFAQRQGVPQKVIEASEIVKDI
ncbi:MAG: hypothetical protein ACTSQY_01330 [Candidatus Odinarchaeia archaeon]